MRPVVRGPIPTEENGDRIIFTNYSRSRRYLINRIGEYCCYCERKIEASLAVEHVQPKSINPALALEWSNFLLGCTNCNSTKGDEPVILGNYIWPDIDNTFACFGYDETGIVNISPNINDQGQSDKIQNMLDLVGLQKYPPQHGSADWERASDRRFEHRIQAWMEANHFMSSYRNSTDDYKQLMIPFITTIVVHQGFWSIWVNVFIDFPEVQVELINNFPGTNVAYFQHLFPIQ